MHTFTKDDNGHYQVGFHDGRQFWPMDVVFSQRDDAAAFVSWLNGGQRQFTPAATPVGPIPDSTGKA